MSDYRKEFIESVERSLVETLDPATLDIIVRKVMKALGDYEITKRTTELAVYDDANERMLKRYLATLLVEGKSQKTIYSYRRDLTRFFDFVGKPYTKVGPYDIRYYLGSEKERGIKNSTIERTRSVIHSLFSWLTVEDEIPKNPCAAVKRIKVQEEERLAFSAVDMDAMRHTCKTPRERALIELLASSGVRVSEACNLNVSDIDFNTMEVHVRHGKGGKSRTTYISDVAKLHLQMYLRTRNENCDALFCNHQHKRLGDDGIRLILDKISERSGVSNVHPHRFRRTLATNLVASGMPIQEVQRILGHSNINTTMRYVCLNDQKVKSSYRQHIA